MAAVYWLIAFVVLLGIEAATMALTTIWFAGGALAAFAADLAGAAVEVQLVVFVVVSFILLLFTRPLAARLLRGGDKTKTNVDSLIGRSAKVTEAIDNELGTGAAVVGGQEWTARSFDGESRFPTGETVVIRAVEGVKLMVSETRKEN